MERGKEETESKKKPSIALVLSGGGGKGAYQIGCWKALRKLGLDRFKIISGTSIGALNAVLVGQRDYQLAEKVWLNLSEDDILDANPIWKFLVKCWIGAFTVVKLIIEYLEAGLIFLFAVVAVPLSLVPLLRYHSGLPTELNDILDLTGTLEVWLSASPWLWAVILAWWCLWISGVIRWSIRLFRGGLRRDFSSHLEDQAMRWRDLIWVASSRALKDLIRKNVSMEKLQAGQARIFANFSIHATVWNPYHPNYYVFWSSDSSIGTPILTDQPQEQVLWGSKFMEISSLSKEEELLDVLVRSANLPIAFQQKDWRSLQSTDGGLTQNTPVLPAIESDAEILIVVYLDDTQVPCVEGVVSDALRDNRFHHLNGLGKQKAQELYDQFVKQKDFPGFPNPDFDVRPDRFIFIVPSEPLGETMAFSGGERAQHLMDLGEKDTLKAIRNNPNTRVFVTG